MKKLLLLLFLVLLVFTGCKAEKYEDGEKKEELDFSIVDADQTPQEVLDMVENQKQDPFKFSYTDGQNLYIVVGYGEKPTGGYSIQVSDLYLSDQAVVIETDLLGPSKEDVVTMALTYPYIVVKTEYIDKPVYYK
jgi:hypothetical protein